MARGFIDEKNEQLRSLVEVAETSRGELDAERYLLDAPRIHRLVVGDFDSSLTRNSAGTLLLHNF